ncbi:MAG: Hpt domain-containing protein [Burkholderiaceae bacterium]|nr:Hpt domain-containing protein [Burkholderiaceae bacterium]
MSEIHDPNQLVGASQDVAPLAWVIDEIRTAFGHAVAATRAFLGNKQDLDSLRDARNQIHQSNGALQLLDLRGVALVAEAVEQLLHRWESKPEECVPSAIRNVESALSAVRAYLESLLAGRPNQPIRLYPYYRDILLLNHAARVHPADLLFPDLSRRPAFHNIEARAFTTDQLRIRRVMYEEGLLGFLRNADDARARRQMRDALCELEHLPQRGLARSFWWVVRGVLDALDAHRVIVDLDLKRLLARLNLQLRRLVDGGQVVAERLMVDALYYVGRSDEKVARVAEIRRLYGLDALIPADFERATLTTVDPDALAALREALAQAKTLWGQLVTSAAPNPARYRQEIENGRVAATRLHAAPLAEVLGWIGRVTEGFAQRPTAAREGLGLEVASALLFVETGADELPQLDPESTARARKVIERLHGALEGHALPEAGPWLSDLARRAQERLSIGTVVSETQATLREIEQRLDRFFRAPAQRDELAGIGPLVDQVCGVMSVLGHEEPVAALRNVQHSVAGLADASAPATQEEFTRIAQNLGAIGFFVETLAQDTARPRGMFRYDPTTGLFSADLARAPEAATGAPGVGDEIELPYVAHEAGPAAPAVNVEAAAKQRLDKARAIAERLAVMPEDQGFQRQIAEVLAQLAHDADLLDSGSLRALAADSMRLLVGLRSGGGRKSAIELVERLTPSRPAVPQPTAPLPASQSAAAEELHEIFVGEGTEVLDSIDEHLGLLRAQPHDLGLMTTVRRGFHTLKGSGRMVGLRSFADGAWAVEQCFNLWLAQERSATEDLLGLARQASDEMRGWLEQVAADPNAPIDPAPLVKMAQTVREAGSAAGHQIPDLMAGHAPPKDDGSAEAEGSPALPTAAVPQGQYQLTLDEDALESEAGEPLEAASEAFEAEAPIEADEMSDAERESAAEQELADLVELARIDSPSSALRASSSAASAASEDEPEGRADDEVPPDDAWPAESSGLQPLYEQTRRIGEIEISHGLYSVFLNESDEAVRALAQDVGEWRYEPERPVSPNTVRRAHSLAGISATVGLHPVHLIAEPLEALMHELAGEHGLAPALTSSQFDVLDRAIEQMRGMLLQFAAGVHPPEGSLEAAAVRELLGVVRAQIEHRHQQALGNAPAGIELVMVPPPEESPEAAAVEPPGAAAEEQVEDEETAASAEDSEEDARMLASEGAALSAAQPAQEAAQASRLVPRPESALRDELDPDLLHVFITEAHDLLPAIGIGLRSLAVNPNDREAARDLMRCLHTVKGSARMAGAMSLGELVHEMETRIESAMQLVSVPAVVIEDLQSQFDQALSLFDHLHAPPQPSPAPEADGVAAASSAEEPEAEEAELQARTAATATGARETAAEPEKPVVAPAAPAAPFIRVRADVLDRLVDHAGEVSIARSKLETEVGTLRGSLTDLTENIQRLRNQLREVEIQAEAQIQARSDQLAREAAAFDPLEFDRFSRLQELTRMLAESVEDVAMVQSTMLKGLQLADNDLSAQSRLTRELQQQLMRVRLVPFSNVSERLYRVARQTAKEVGKRVHLEIVGGTTEIDRGVLERMSGPFEHLVRNAIVHGIEPPERRLTLGKPESGELRIDVKHEGNEIIVTFSDDGAGLNLERIRQRAIELNLLDRERHVSERDLAEFVFAPGFSTAHEVTELAGRGIGMDVVRSELASFGGRILVTTEAGRGTRFTAYLPLTLAVTQVVLATVAGRRFAIPSAMVQQVRRFKASDVDAGLRDGMLAFGSSGTVVLRPLAQLLGIETPLALVGRQTPVGLLRSGEDRLAVVVDDMTPNQEVVVKNVGPQVSRLTGVLGATILGSGEIVLILNPVQLIGRAPEPSPLYVPAPVEGIDVDTEAIGATIMVVDDSLTVRRVTQRLLERQGFQVLLAKDGVDALRQMQDTMPDVLLVDIEMPRMDGYDLTRAVRSNPETQAIPILMITSRTAAKHRALAFELGVNEYLGKPYQEEELLRLIRRHLAARASA